MRAFHTRRASLADEKALVTLLVAVRLPGRARRVNITLEENLLADIDHTAGNAGMSRSAFVAKGAKRLMARIRSAS